MSPQPDFLHASCPSRQVLDLLADKWSLLIIAAISRGVTRNGALLREIGDISQKMLTQTLRTLEANGLLRREVVEIMPPHVEYHLTPLGASLIPVVHTLGHWAETHFQEVRQAQAATARLPAEPTHG